MIKKVKFLKKKLFLEHLFSELKKATVYKNTSNILNNLIGRNRTKDILINQQFILIIFYLLYILTCNM